MRLKCPLRHLELALPHPAPTSWVLVASWGFPCRRCLGQGGALCLSMHVLSLSF